VLDAAAGALRPLAPFGRGLDVCCGTGAGMRVLRSLCQGPVMGVDFSTGMLAQARRAHPDATWVRAASGRCPSPGRSIWRSASGRSGTSCPPNGPHCSPACTARCGRAGCSRSRPAPVTSSWYWALLGFDLAMRVRNAVWHPPFVMYYRTCPLHAVRGDLTAAGFTVTTVPVTAAPGRREDGGPRYRLVLARTASTP
jgi:hypothetical protein